VFLGFVQDHYNNRDHTESVSQPGGRGGCVLDTHSDKGAHVQNNKYKTVRCCSASAPRLLLVSTLFAGYSDLEYRIAGLENIITQVFA